MKGYHSREKHLSLYQLKAYSLFHTTLCQGSVYFCDALKRNNQFLDFFVIVNYTKTFFMHSIDFVIKLSAMQHQR